MAYTPYNAVKAIYNLKGAWDSANKSGDETKKNTAASDAVKWYQELRANGYGSLADELQGQDYTAAKATHDYYAKTGRTKTRPYFYDLGKAYGLSTSDVDALIGWDDTTGEVTFGGKKVGTPDAVVDGTSYWNDTAVLDKAFTDYVDRTGLTRAKDSAVNQENEYLFDKYREEYESLKNTNPFETETGKAILAKYDLAGLQGRDNELASGAGDNGGNVDSFAAANAMRQQAALVNQGQLTAIEAHQKQLDHARALLSDMGVNIDRVYNQDETSKNNKVSREVAISESTGFITDDQLKATSNMWDDSGALLDTDTNYQEKINELVEASKNPNLTAAEKQDIALALKLLEMGRNDKITQTGSKEAKTYNYQKPFENANMKLTKAQIESAEKMIGLEGKNALDQIQEQGKVTKELYDAGIGPDGKPNKVGDDVTVITVPENAASDIATIINAGEYGNKNIDGVDYYGAKLLEAFLKKYPYGESVDNFVSFAQQHSKEYHVDLNQLTKLCGYLGVEPSITEQVLDRYENVEDQYTGRTDGITWSNGIRLKIKVE